MLRLADSKPLAILLALLGLLAPSMAHALILVDSTSGASSLPTACTLRAAVTAAMTNQNQGGCIAPAAGVTTEQIYFALPPDSVITLTERDPGSVNAGLRRVHTGRNLEIASSDGVRIVRSASLTCNLDATQQSGEFRLLEISSGATVSVSNVRFQNGCADGPLDPILDTPAEGKGGAIYNAGNLSLFDAVFFNNQALFEGGAVVASSSPGSPSNLLVIHSDFYGNVASDGGAVRVSGASAEIDSSTFRLNASTGDIVGASGYGSAINAALAYVSSTLLPSSLILRNSTVSGNFQFSDGFSGDNYAVWVHSSDEEILFSTISNNAGVGLGVDNSGFGEPNKHVLSGSILSGNSGPNCQYFLRVASSLLRPQPSVSSDNQCADPNNGGLIFADPQLGALSNNGGGVPTQLPAGTSPVRDIANCEVPGPTGVVALTIDGRGAPRPVGVRCDAGAVELQITDRIFASGFEAASGP